MVQQGQPYPFTLTAYRLFSQTNKIIRRKFSARTLSRAKENLRPIIPHSAINEFRIKRATHLRSPRYVLFTATATETTAATYAFIFAAIAQKENKHYRQDSAARAYLVDHARYTSATAAAHHEQYYQKIKIVIVIA